MPNYGYQAKPVLRRIADALGVDPVAFLEESGELQAVRERLELLTAFDRLANRHDRRICIDFVKAILARQELTTAP